MEIEVPPGLTVRPLRQDDAHAVYEVQARQEQHDLGRVEIDPADIVSDWQRPSFDVGTSTIGVLDGDLLVGYAEITSEGRGDAAVDPAYRRRGIGTALAGWMRHTAGGRGYSAIGTPVPEGSAGDRLLESLGYHVRWTSWVLKVPPGKAITPRDLPAGYTLREARPDEYEEVWNVVEDAFLEWAVRSREPLEDFLASTVQRPGFEPWCLRIVTDDTAAVVGTALVIMYGDPVDEAYVDRLAVRRDQRGRGLAQALLVDAFEQGRAHGAPSSGLSTDSRTGALSLYRKVGMEVADVWVNRGATL